MQNPEFKIQNSESEVSRRSLLQTDKALVARELWRYFPDEVENFVPSSLYVNMQILNDGRRVNSLAFLGRPHECIPLLASDCLRVESRCQDDLEYSPS